MGNLVLIPADSYGMGILQQRNVVCTSRAVAEMFGKRHDNVIRDIENAASDLLKIEEIKENYFIESVHAAEAGNAASRRAFRRRSGDQKAF